VPPRPAKLVLPAPVVEIAAPLSEMPTNGPPVVGVACRFADRSISPSAAVMLAPDANAMFFKTVMLTPPVPLTAMSLAALGKLTVPPSATVRPRLAAKVIGPFRLTMSDASSPRTTSEAKPPASELTLTTSLPLVATISSHSVGLSNVVVSPSVLVTVVWPLPASVTAIVSLPPV